MVSLFFTLGLLIYFCFGVVVPFAALAMYGLTGIIDFGIIIYYIVLKD